MTSEAEGVARQILEELEERLATHDLERMLDFFTSDVVLIGDAVENFELDSTRDYLKLMADMAPTVRWHWDNVVPILSRPDVMCFAAAGTMTFHNEVGESLGEGERFRVTCLALQSSEGWRLKHFHGSAPAAE